MDNANTAPESNSPLRVDTSGSDYTPTNPTIAPEDRELAQSLTDFDPVHDVKGPVEWVGGTRKAPEHLSVSMLSPEQRGPIDEQLKAVPLSQREAMENDLVRKALYQNSFQLRILAGPGENANEFQRERFGIARERYDLDQELWSLNDQLQQVSRWEPVFDETGAKVIDPATGQQKLRAVEAVQGLRREAMQRRMAEIGHKLRLLDGSEGDRREMQALKATIDRMKASQAEIAEDREARAKAGEIVRKERIEAKAQSYAKMHRGSL